MKYLKQYENINNDILHIGDYVIIDSNWLENIGQIVNILWRDNIDSISEYKVKTYTLSRLRYNKKEEKILSLDKKEIIRKATQKEIDDYILQNDINKYNL